LITANVLINLEYHRTTTVSVSSSELRPPSQSHPFSRRPQASMSLPRNQKRNQRRRKHIRLRMRGWGSPNSDNCRKSLALCLLCALAHPKQTDFDFVIFFISGLFFALRRPFFKIDRTLREGGIHKRSRYLIESCLYFIIFRERYRRLFSGVSIPIL
jgi:hypothetical protein